MGKKSKETRPLPEYLGTAAHVVTLAEAVLEQIGRSTTGQPSPSMPTRIAEWSRNPNGVNFRLEQYDYDDQTRKYLFEIANTEDGLIFEFRTRGYYNEPKLYYIEEDGRLVAMDSMEARECQGYLRQILTNANKQAAKKAETRSTDREFEQVVGRYILSDLAIRPLAKTREDESITPARAKAYADDYSNRTETIENEVLQKPLIGRRIQTERAVKNKPTGERFLEIDAQLLAGLAARELGDTWPNTIDLSKPPTERRPKAS